MPPDDAMVPDAPPKQVEPRTILSIVFATILIDFIGFSILIPVLPEYADELGASAFQVGLIVAVYALVQLLFLPAWGWFSDRFGRRPVILVSLTGTIASFLLLSVADSLSVIYMSRILGGFFAASVGTAQAVVTDVTPPNQRASGMGKIGAALGVAFVLGPALGGILADFGVKVPFYAVAVIAALNLVIAWIYLPETRAIDENAPAQSDLWRSLVPTPIRVITSIRDRRIALYLYLWFHIYLAFAAVEGSFPLYLLRRYEVTPLEVGLIFAWIGIFIAITQGLIVGRLAHYMKESTMVMVGLVITAAGLVAITFSPSYTWLYVVGPVVAIGNGVAFPSFTSLYSQTCTARQAGESLGQGNSMGIAGRVLGAMTAGLLMDVFTLGTPFVVAGMLMLSAAVIFASSQPLLVPVRQPLS